MNKGEYLRLNLVTQKAWDVSENKKVNMKQNKEILWNSNAKTQ
jgi:hypothetical protein